MAKGVRQDLSPILFNLLIADIGDHMKKKGWVRLSEKIYTLMYADDVALMAEEEQDRDR